MKIMLMMVVALLPIMATAQSIRVVDGDTIDLDGKRVRLWGIDAPELHQRCSGDWHAGVEAARKMQELTRGHVVECDDRGHDRYGRTIGLCRADGVDVQAEMVKAGMAWAFVRYSRDYEQLEEKARDAGIGIFAHGCKVAWEWRAEHPR